LCVEGIFIGRKKEEQMANSMIIISVYNQTYRVKFILKSHLSH